MARAATAEVFDSVEQPQRSMPFRLPVSPRIPTGSQVVLKGNFQADPSQPSSSTTGWVEHPMTENAGNFEVTVPDLQVGATYEYLYIVTPPGATAPTYIKDPGNAALNRKIIIGAEPARSPSPTTDLARVRQSLKGRVGTIVQTAQSSETAQNLEAVFDDLAADIDRLNITENVTPLVLQLLSEIIRELPSIPKAVKDQFPENRPVADLADLQGRINTGSAVFRRNVFTRLRTGADAQRIFRLTGTRATYNPIDTFGDARMNAAFGRICGERDLGAMVPALQTAFRSVADVPARSPVLAADRQRLLNQVATRLTPEQQALLTQVPSSRLGRIVDAAVQGGIVLAGGLSLTTPLLLAAKAGIETLAGVGVRDLVSAAQPDATGQRQWGDLLSRIWANNGVRRLLTAQTGAVGETAKTMLKETAIKAFVPTSSLWYQPALPPTQPGTVNPVQPEVAVSDPEQLIRAARDAALND